MSTKYEDITLKLPRDVVKEFEEVARLAKVPFNTVIKVILAHSVKKNR